MSALDRLLDYLPGVYDSTAAPILGLRLTYATGQMQWSIADDTLTTTVLPAGPGVPLSIDLSQYTLATLAAFLGAQPGYSVLYIDGTGYADVSTLALVPGSGDIATSNGDHIYVAQNPTWTLLASIAAELELTATAITLMPLEMQTTTADGSWLDLLGSYYAVPRQLGEQDPQYSPRIPAEVILPRQNNVAIAAALEASTGQIATCTDAVLYGNPEPAFDGQISFSGAPHFYNATAALILNLFDVTIGYALLGGLSPSDFLILIRRQIDRLRAAGTHLRDLTLTASTMGDVFTPPTDALTETIAVQGITGTGQSYDFAFVTGIFPTLLVPLSFSSDAGIAALTTGALLVGTGQSFDRVAFPLGTASGSSSDGVTLGGFSTGFSSGFNVARGTPAVLSTHSVATLAGTSTSIDATFGSLGTAAIFNGVPASSDSAVAALRTGAGFVGTSSSVDSGVLFRFVGTASSADSGGASLSSGIPLAGAGASSDAGTLGGPRGYSAGFSSGFH